MVDIWKYANDLPFVEVTEKNGNVFSGKVIHVIDAEEIEESEDYISVEAKGGEIRLLSASEIKSIKRVSNER